MSSTRLPALSLRWRVAAALATVYVIWGSTYLAIRFAIQTLPPLLMGATRFLVAGALLYAWVRLRGAPRPRAAQWRAAGIVGALLLLAGNGGVIWAEQVVPSSLAALLVGMVPVWMALLDWLRPGGVRPVMGVVMGLLLGLGGVALLASPGHLAGSSQPNLLGVGVLLLAGIGWAAGSLYSRSGQLPTLPLLATAMEMLAGGVLLLIGGSLVGEWARLDLQAVSLRSALALAYLVVAGSLVGFTAYIWLLRIAPPALVSTYAYVNPVVAVFLGWALAGEAVTARTLLAAAVILTGVVVITTHRARDHAVRAPSSAPDVEPDEVARAATRARR